MGTLHKPRFSFVANSAEAGDESGIATWEIATWDRGDWATEFHKIALPSFRMANTLNTMFASVWDGGEAEGHAHCEKKVLEALR